LFSVEKSLQEQMRNAFWDIFEENLNKVPPVYNQAFCLIDEMKRVGVSSN